MWPAISPTAASICRKRTWPALIIPGADLAARIYDERFVGLMQFEADRAHEYFRKAAAFLPPEDRRSMVSAEIMASIYGALLSQMERDRFRVFERDYRLSKLSKFLHASRQLLKLA